MHRLTCSGNLGNVPELRTVQTKDGEKSVTNFSLAVNEGPKDNQKTTWYDCSAWGPTAEFITRAAAKGQKVLVEGTPSTEEFDRKDGTKGFKNKLSIHTFFLGAPAAPKGSANDVDEPDMSEGDIPF